MLVALVLCAICIIVLSVIIVHKNKKYDALFFDATHDRAFLVTLSEFVIHTKAHSDTEVVTNDMINAIKTCVNKRLYNVTLIDDNFALTQNEIYYSFAEQMFKFVEDMDNIDKE